MDIRKLLKIFKETSGIFPQTLLKHAPQSTTHKLDRQRTEMFHFVAIF